MATSSRLVDAFVAGLALAPLYIAMMPTGVIFACGRAPLGPEVEGATFYVTRQAFADRLIAAAAEELRELADVIGLAELTAELYAIAEVVGVRLLNESDVQCLAAEAVERVEHEFAEQARTGGLKELNARYKLLRISGHEWIMEGEVEVYTTLPFEVPPEATAETEGDEAGATILMRVPASLKQRIDKAARESGMSVNVFMMRCSERCLGDRNPG
jgi:hypothetical protein